MTLNDVRELFAYNKWANEQVWSTVQPVAAEQLSRDLGGSFPSILRTLAHIAGAEWVWLSRWNGVNPTSQPDWAATLAVDGIRRKFLDLEHERATFLNTLREEDVDRPTPFRLFSGAEDTQPLSVLFQHVVNHGTYHRGQIAGMLRQIGATPDADLIRWVRERK